MADPQEVEEGGGGKSPGEGRRLRVMLPQLCWCVQSVVQAPASAASCRYQSQRYRSLSIPTALTGGDHNNRCRGDKWGCLVLWGPVATCLPLPKAVCGALPRSPPQCDITHRVGTLRQTSWVGAWLASCGLQQTSPISTLGLTRREVNGVFTGGKKRLELTAWNGCTL